MLRYYRGNYLVSATTRALEDAVAAWCPETLTERNGKGAAGKRGGGGGGGGEGSSSPRAAPRVVFRIRLRDDDAHGGLGGVEVRVR
jgi:hypothetical protein